MKKKTFTIKEFKAEFRLICTDTWGETMEVWFTIAEELWFRNLAVPSEWEFRPSAILTTNDGREKDSYWFELFDKAKAKDLRKIGALIHRYAQFLKYKKIDY